MFYNDNFRSGNRDVITALIGNREETKKKKKNKTNITQRHYSKKIWKSVLSEHIKTGD